MTRSTLLFLFVCLASTVFDVSAQSTTQCSSNSDCTTAGCTCVNEICVDADLLESDIVQCPTCSSNSNCTANAEDSCLSGAGRCSECFDRTSLPALTKCIRPSSESPKPVVQVPRDGTCSSNNNCMNGCQCYTNVTEPFCVSRSVTGIKAKCQSPCAKNEQGTDCAECRSQILDKAGKECIPICVSTAFLMERGLGHAAIRHFGTADVLCIPGLPCGTAGHLLRECTSDATCKLVSYAQVCQHRGDCVASNMAVSQLKHSFDWSQYHISSGSTTLSLTSLSASPGASQMTPSRIVAKMADLLNEVGLGFVCDAVATLPYSLAEISNKFLSSESL